MIFFNFSFLYFSIFNLFLLILFVLFLSNIFNYFSNFFYFYLIFFYLFAFFLEKIHFRRRNRTQHNSNMNYTTRTSNRIMPRASNRKRFVATCTCFPRTHALRIITELMGFGEQGRNHRLDRDHITSLLTQIAYESLSLVIAFKCERDWTISCKRDRTKNVSFGAYFWQLTLHPNARPRSRLSAHPETDAVDAKRIHCRLRNYTL